MDTLREMLKIAESHHATDWIKQQLAEGALSKQLNESAQKDPAFNQYLKNISDGDTDV